MEIKNLVGRVVGINRTEKINKDGLDVENYRVTIEFVDADYKAKLTITTEDEEVATQFRLNQEFQLRLFPANKTLSDFDDEPDDEPREASEP